MGKKDQQRLAERFTPDAPLSAAVITLSDRASKGEYEDKSGPRVRDHLSAFFTDAGIAFEIETAVLPDDACALKDWLVAHRDADTHLIVTTGGTGVGPRDITPDMVTALADKIIPGVMEVIRAKYAADKPNAALSRAVAAVMGKSLVYTIPGSTKGVDEYMTELFKTMDHTLCVIHGLEKHD